MTDANTDSARLRERFARRSPDELQAILDAPPGDYTPEAVVVAREELASRPLPAPGSEPDAASRQGSTRSPWQAFLGFAVAAQGVKVLFRVYRDWERDPASLQATLAAVGGSPWTYGFVGALAVWLWWRRR